MIPSNVKYGMNNTLYDENNGLETRDIILVDVGFKKKHFVLLSSLLIEWHSQEV